MRPLVMGLCSCCILLGQTNVVTSNYDNYRTSWDQTESLLSPANVNVNTFGKLFSIPVDGTVFAQPLHVSSLSIAGAGTHNVLFVATMHNSVYAFDAESGYTYWTTNLGPSVPTNAYSYPDQNYTYTDIIPEIGILGTPAIDLPSNTIFVVADIFQNNQYSYVLHALDLSSGQEKSGSPVTIQGSVSGSGAASDDNVLLFDASLHLQRPGLLVSNGRLFIAFGSHGDVGNFHGWIMNYDISTLKQTWVFSTTPNGQGGAIWQSGRGIAIGDDGFLYAVIGNGDYDGSSNWGESAIRLDPNTVGINDWFTPEDWVNLNDKDLDFGSAGPILVPGTPYIIAAGKEGYLYVMDNTQLGQLQSADAQLVSKVRFGAKSSTPDKNVDPHILQSFQPTGTGTFNYAFWKTSTASYVFLRASYDVLKAFQMGSDGTFQTTPSSVATTQHAKPFDGITVSSNGTNAATGIVWQTSEDAASQPSSGILHAYQASDVSNEIWNSGMNSLRDGYGGFVKFANPTVANGKVYMATASNKVVVYGPLPFVAAQTITQVMNGASGASGAIAPGEIVEILGNSIGPASPAGGAVSDNVLGNSLGGVQVLFNGVPAPLLYAGPNEISAVAPFEISGSTSVSIQIANGSTATKAFANPVSSSAPALFTLDGSGAAQCSCLNDDYTTNGPANPASPGDVVVLYATGQGLTDPLPQDGAVSASPYPTPTLSVKVTIGGEQAQVLFAGAAPGMVGVLQINAVVPMDAASNLIAPVVLTVGGQSSPPTVTIAIQ